VTVDDIRRLALSLPEAVEQPHFDRTSFRVRDKIFATLHPNGEWVMLKLPIEVKEAVIAADPQAHIALPGAWERSGSTQLEIGRMDEGKLTDLVLLAWRGVAPKALWSKGEGR
jgi:hypothetical protein